jgi:copper chaperone
MLCYRCLMNVVKTLSLVKGIEEIHVNLESKK